MNYQWETLTIFYLEFSPRIQILIYSESQSLYVILDIVQIEDSNFSVDDL